MSRNGFSLLCLFASVWLHGQDLQNTGPNELKVISKPIEALMRDVISYDCDLRKTDQENADYFVSGLKKTLKMTDAEYDFLRSESLACKNEDQAAWSEFAKKGKGDLSPSQAASAKRLRFERKNRHIAQILKFLRPEVILAIERDY